MYMGFFGAWCFYATAAPPPTAGAAPTATGWPAMFARTPAIPTRTCSQMVVIFASVPLPAPAAAAVFGTMAMMDPKIVPRSSTTGIVCFSCLRRGEESVPDSRRRRFAARGRAVVSSIVGASRRRTCVRLSRRPKAPGLAASGGRGAFLGV